MISLKNTSCCLAWDRYLHCSRASDNFKIHKQQCRGPLAMQAPQIKFLLGWIPVEVTQVRIDQKSQWRGKNLACCEPCY